MFWCFICDACDIAGIWKVDLEMAAFLCGVLVYDSETLLQIFDGRIKDIGNERWFVIKFIEFQQGPELNPKNNCHLGIIRRLERLNIPSPVRVSPCQGAAMGLPSPIGKGTSKSTSKGKSKEIGEVQEGKENKARPQSRQDVLDYVRSIGLPETDGHYFFDHWQSNGYKNSGKPVLDWKATIRSWQQGNHLPSQKKTNPSHFQKPECLRMSWPRDWQEAKRQVRFLEEKVKEHPEVKARIEALEAQFKL